ncbi:IS4 family transposase, partial [Enterococcus sp. CWB-B31]|nr:IS4 family transposase [Enterococcus sp. CWB-B31]
SEQKAMSVLVPFLPDLFPAIQADGILLRNLLGEIFRFLEQNGKKSRRKGKKTSLDILVAISLE